MGKKKVIVSRSGLTNCPSCMSHITLDASLEHTECPFCQTNLVAERRESNEVFGRNVLKTLSKSKSAMLAAALGASLSMAACGEKDGEPEDMGDNDMDMMVEPADVGAPAADMYGGPPINDNDMDMMVEPADVGAPTADMYGAPPVDQDQGD